MKKNQVLGMVILLVGIVFVVLTTQIPVRSITDDPGPRVFPYFACSILIISGIGIMFGKKARAGSGEPFLTKDGWKRVGILTGLFVLYAVGLAILGFFIATPIMLYLFYHVVAGPTRRSVLRGLIFSAVSFVAIYLVFARVLHSFLPPGMIF